MLPYLTKPETNERAKKKSSERLETVTVVSQKSDKFFECRATIVSRHFYRFIL